MNEAIKIAYGFIQDALRDALTSCFEEKKNTTRAFIQDKKSFESWYVETQRIYINKEYRSVLHRKDSKLEPLIKASQHSLVCVLITVSTFLFHLLEDIKWTTLNLESDVTLKESLDPKLKSLFSKFKAQVSRDLEHKCSGRLKHQLDPNAELLQRRDQSHQDQDPDLDHDQDPDREGEDPEDDLMKHLRQVAQQEQVDGQKTNLGPDIELSNDELVKYLEGMMQFQTLNCATGVTLEDRYRQLTTRNSVQGSMRKQKKKKNYRQKKRNQKNCRPKKGSRKGSQTGNAESPGADPKDPQ